MLYLRRRDSCGEAILTAVVFYCSFLTFCLFVLLLYATIDLIWCWMVFPVECVASDPGGIMALEFLWTAAGQFSVWPIVDETFPQSAIVINGLTCFCQHQMKWDFPQQIKVTSSVFQHHFVWLLLIMYKWQWCINESAVCRQFQIWVCSACLSMRAATWYMWLTAGEQISSQCQF